MTLDERLKVQRILKTMADEQGCTIAQIRRSIQVCIDDGWRISWDTNDEEAQQRWLQIFPDGKKPTVDQFIVALAKRITAGEDVPYILEN